MISEYHNHTLQANLRHLGDELQKNYIQTTSEKKQSKASGFLFLVRMVAKLERHSVMQNKQGPNAETTQAIGGLSNEITSKPVEL